MRAARRAESTSVSRTAPTAPAEPAELRPRTGAVRAGSSSGGEAAQIRAQPAGRHTELVDVLGVVAEPDARIVMEDRGHRAARGVADQIDDGGARGQAGTTASGGLVAGSPRARTSLGMGGSAPQPAPTSRDNGGLEETLALPGGVQLNLDFPEPPRRVPVVRDRDGVVDDLGQKLPVAAADLDGPPDRRQTGHRLEELVPGGGEHQVGGRVGNLVGGTLEADLPADQVRTPVVLGELHRPGGAGLPVAVAHGDAGTSQAQVGGVVVGGVEVRYRQHCRRGARHQAVQVGQSEPGWRHELGLAFDSCSAGAAFFLTSATIEESRPIRQGPRTHPDRHNRGVRCAASG